MNFTFRKLKSDDLFLMFEIVSKIGIVNLKEVVTPDKIKSVINQDNDDFTTLFGMSVVMEVATVIIKNLPCCKNEIYKFLSEISGMSTAEIGDLDMISFTEMIIEVIKKPEFKDFFKVVSKLFK